MNVDEITIEGIKAVSIDIENFSLRLLLFSTNDSINTVAKLPNVYLHPTRPPGPLYISALFGSYKEYDIYSNKIINDLIFSQVFTEYKQNNDENWDAIREEVAKRVKAFVPWYNEL